jgi:DNA-directed RNA polymerase specialized sigma24 family protein
MTRKTITGEALLGAIAAYQRSHSERDYQTLATLLQPFIRSFLGAYHWCLGGIEEARQHLALALLEAVTKYDTTRSAQHAVHEVWCDLWKSLEPHVRRGRRHTRLMSCGAPLKLEHDPDTETARPRAQSAEVELDTRLDPARSAEETFNFLGRDPYALLDQAVRRRLIKPRTRALILLRYRDELTAREAARRLRIPYQGARQELNRGLRRVLGSKRQMNSVGRRAA